MTQWNELSAFHSSTGIQARKIIFVPARQADAQSAVADVELVPLNDPVEMPHDFVAAAPSPRGAVFNDTELFRESHVPLKWKSARKVAAGLQNLGNTCFLNSVLQCLTHTPPLAELSLSDRDLGRKSDNDLVYLTQQHIRKAFTGANVVSPVSHAKSLRQVNKRFRLGRQEDSHEYLRCLLDSMHESCLKLYPEKPPPEIATTTLIYRIFGGKLRSQIRCDGVKYESNTYDPFLDLSLEINKSSSLIRALQHFTAPEILDGPNRYRCPKNNQLVRAVKQITVEEAPNVLTIQFKRFEFGSYGSKISKKVEFDIVLDIEPFMSHKGRGPQLYELYAVLVHHGHSVHSGHYICYVKAPNGMWHVCDDNRVAQVSERQVLGQQAYILFYVRQQPRKAAQALSTKPAVTQKAVPQKVPAQPEAQLTHDRNGTQAAVAKAASQLKLNGLSSGSSQDATISSKVSTQDRFRQDAAKSGTSAGTATTSSTESTAQDSCISLPLPRLSTLNKTKKRDRELSPGRPSTPTGRLRAVSALLPAKNSQLTQHSSFLLHLQCFSQICQYKQKLKRMHSAGARLESLPDLASGSHELHHTRSLPTSTSGEITNGEVAHCKGDGKHKEAGTVQQTSKLARVSAAGHHFGQQPDTHEPNKLSSVNRNADLAVIGVNGFGTDNCVVHNTSAKPLSVLKQKPSELQSPFAAAQARKVVNNNNRSTVRDVPPAEEEDALVGAEALEWLAPKGTQCAAYQTWEGGDVSLAREAAALARASRPKRQKVDEWDAEYDRGKMKKVRSKKHTLLDEGNAFHEHAMSSRRGGRGMRDRGGRRGGRDSDGNDRRQSRHGSMNRGRGFSRGGGRGRGFQRGGRGRGRGRG